MLTLTALKLETHLFTRTNDIVDWKTLKTLVQEGKPYPLIMTPNGWREVSDAWKVVEPRVLTLEAAKVAKITCSPEHPIDEWLPNRTATTELDYDLGWLLGLYAAEGGFENGSNKNRCKFTVHKKETEILDRAQAIVERKFCPKTSRSIRARYGCAILRFSSRDWRMLATKIVTGNVWSKSLNLSAILSASRDFRGGIWDGYIIGDGCKRRDRRSRKGYLEFVASSASERLRDHMTVVASSVGTLTSKGMLLVHDKRTGKTYTRYHLWTVWTHKKRKKGTLARELVIRNKIAHSGSYEMIGLEVEGELFLVENGLAAYSTPRNIPHPVQTSLTHWV